MTLSFVDLLTPFVVEVWGSVVWILMLVVLDFVLGVLSAILNKEYQWDKLSQFLETGVLLKLVGYLVFAFVMFIGQHLPGAFIPEEILIYSSDVIFGILVLSVVMGSILPHLADIGLVPTAAADYIKRVGRGE